MCFNGSWFCWDFGSLPYDFALENKHVKLAGIFVDTAFWSNGNLANISSKTRTKTKKSEGGKVMNFQGTDIVFLLIIGVAAYAYAAFVFSREPDPSTEFGISLNAMLAGLLAFGATIVAFAIMLFVGKIGYVIVIIAYPFVFPRIIKKMILGDKKTSA